METKQPQITSFLKSATEKIEEQIVSPEPDKCDLELLCKQYEERLKVSEKKLKHATLLIKESAKINLEKDMKISALNEKIRKSVKQEQVLLFTSFEEQFEQRELKMLRSTRMGAKNDSTFVKNLVQIVYKSCLYKLQNRSAVGKMFKKKKRTNYPTKKKKMMQAMLSERILSENGDDYVQRINKFNSHLKSAIHNTNKAQIRRQSKNMTHAQPEAQQAYSYKTLLDGGPDTQPIHSTNEAENQCSSTNDMNIRIETAQQETHTFTPLSQMRGEYMHYQPLTHEESHTFTGLWDPQLYSHPINSTNEAKKNNTILQAI